jgi:dienelactone hydrolase
MQRRSLLIVVLAAALVAAAFEAADYQRGAALVIDAAGLDGWMDEIAEVNERSFSSAAQRVPSRHGPLPARVYQPRRASERAVLLVPGVHAGGIEEPRLVGFAEDLARRGITVATVELPDLKRYEITARTTDVIEDAALWLGTQRELSADGRVGIMGISFGGGLAVAAAGRPALRERVAYTLSFGGHGDLPRTLRYLCTGRQPDGTYRPPHDYGVVIILLGVADRVVPSDQVTPLRQAILVFLEASHVDMVDKNRAGVLFREAVDLAGRLPEPAATFMRYVNERNVKTLGGVLLPHVQALAGDPALSAERSPPPHAPVYLLHGTDDNVIPAVESLLLARHLERSTDVRVLLSPLITHAEVDRPTQFGEIWKLVAFWSDVLDE